MLSEHHLTVHRTARYAVLGGMDGGVADLWIVCHGYGQRAAKFARGFECIASDKRRIVAPEALSRFYVEGTDARTHSSAKVGASWMTREEREAEISDYVEYLNALWRHVSSGNEHASLTVLGFSQGASTAARWCVLGDARPNRLVLWGASVPRDLLSGTAVERLRGIPLVLVAGTKDHYATDAAVAAELTVLAERGLTPLTHRFEGGHTLDAATLTLIADSYGSGLTT